MAIDQGIVPGPRLLPCSRNFGTTSGYIDLEPWWYRMGNVGACRMADGPDGMRQAVREELKRGARMIKLFVTGGHGNLRQARGPSREELAGGRDPTPAAPSCGPLRLEARDPRVRQARVDVIDHGDEIDAEASTRCRTGTFFDPSSSTWRSS
jgi:hypothetical protein